MLLYSEIFVTINVWTIMFTDYAEYDTGTGYIVAENKEIGFCYICRILDKSEIKLLGGNNYDS